MAQCNVVFGRTGCGKTSLKNMLVGGEPEEDSMVSGTSDAAVLSVALEGNDYLYVDTAGILDNRGEEDELAQSRSVKVNSIGDLLKRQNLTIARVFYCVSVSERLLKEEIDWLADIVQMMGGEQIMKCFAIVLTKVDAGFKKTQMERDFENKPNVQCLRKAFPGCPIVTAGHGNTEAVAKLLVASRQATAFKVQPSEIKTIKPKADLETQMKFLQAQLSNMQSKLSDEASKPADIQDEINDLDNQIDDLSEQIANASWWCPWVEIQKANDRIRACRNQIRILRQNQGQSREHIENFQTAKKKLLEELRQAQADMAEKTRLGGIFKMMLGL